MTIEEEDTKEILLEKRLTSTTGKKINYTFETDEWHMYDKVYPLSIKEIDFDEIDLDEIEIEEEEEEEFEEIEEDEDDNNDLE